MAALIAGQGAAPGQPGTRPAAWGDEGFPGRRSRRPEHGAQAARRGGKFPRGRVPARRRTRG